MRWGGCTSEAQNRSNREDACGQEQGAFAQNKNSQRVKQPFQTQRLSSQRTTITGRGAEAYQQGLAKYYANYSQYVDGLDNTAKEWHAGNAPERVRRRQGEIASKKTLADSEAKLADAKTQLKESEETFNEKKEDRKPTGYQKAESNSASRRFQNSRNRNTRSTHAQRWQAKDSSI